jgi:flagellar biosynthesis anti-sigma factor FlgM
MKIQNQNPVQLEIAKLQNVRQAEFHKDAAPLQSPTEKVTFSQEAVNTKQIEADLAGMPDVRTDMVNRIKAEVDAGAYQRPAAKVADALLTSRLIDSLYRR